MKIDSSFVPESPEEEQLLEDLARVRNEALDNGMSKEEVSRVFSMYAEGLLSPSFERQDGTVTKEENPVCPSCGSVVYDFVVTGLGERPVLEECGCMVDYEDVPDSLK